jgi:hypothetical protein
VSDKKYSAKLLALGKDLDSGSGSHTSGLGPPLRRHDQKVGGGVKNGVQRFLAWKIEKT